MCKKSKFVVKILWDGCDLFMLCFFKEEFLNGDKV